MNSLGRAMRYDSIQNKPFRDSFESVADTEIVSVAQSRVKRGVDIVLSATALLFLAPLMLVLLLLVYLQDGGTPIFAQTRVGVNGKRFKCLKIRSMVTDAQERLEKLLATDPKARIEWETDHKIRNDPRITALGRFIRKTSLDELPQLINILRGDMSIVGPRPIVEKEVARYGAQIDFYKQVRPGLTGLWQVSGRNDISYVGRVALDVEYVKNWSFWSDVKIIVMTVPSILFSRGAY